MTTIQQQLEFDPTQSFREIPTTFAGTLRNPSHSNSGERVHPADEKVGVLQ